jgi:hypothetical protein
VTGPELTGPELTDPELAGPEIDDPELDDPADASELLALGESVKALLRRAPAGAAWGPLCAEIGVAGLGIPARYGGVGGGLAELAAVAEVLGAGLTRCPMLGSAVLAGQAVLAAADEANRERLLPLVAEGATAALAWAGPDGRWDPAAPACRFDGARLHGVAHHVLDGADASLLIVAATGPAGVGLYEVDPEHAERSATEAMDQSRPLATVRLAGCPGTRLGPDDHTGALARARDMAAVVLAAEQVGAAAHCLAATVAYTQQRVQFGQPIARFQALQHRMADLHVLVETARSAVWAATRSEPAELPAPAAVARVHCCEVALRVAGEMIQLHGGIAITWEHEAHRYFKRAHGSAQLLGQPAEHVARLAGMWGPAC